MLHFEPIRFLTVDQLYAADHWGGNSFSDSAQHDFTAPNDSPPSSTKIRAESPPWCSPFWTSVGLFVATLARLVSRLLSFHSARS